MKGNGSPFAPPSPATDRRVAAHLRGARGKSPAYLARRYRRALRGYMAALAAGADQQGYAELNARIIVALKLCGQAAEDQRRAAEAQARKVRDTRERGIYTDPIEERDAPLRAALERDRLRRKGY